MQQWEYKTLHRPTLDQLAEIGGEGYEAVGMVILQEDYEQAANEYLLFKRPKEEKKESCGCIPMQPVFMKHYCQKHTPKVECSYGTSGTAKEQPCTCVSIPGGSVSHEDCPKHDA